MASVEFCNLFPAVPSHNVMFMLEAMTYKVSLKINREINVNQLEVEVWTNMYHQDNSEGKWHGIQLPLINGQHNGIYEYGKSIFITSNHYFQFSFRAQLKGRDWVWSNDFGVNGCVEVYLPREYDSWTQGPNYDHILESVYCGNFLAASQASKLGFTHVLNTADNLDMVYEPHQQVQYRKIGMVDGAHNVIAADLIKRAVDWLLENDKPENKILVHCRAGIGRAGSTVVGFVYAKNENYSFEDAKQFVLQRRWIYPHRDLDVTLARMYPRQC